MPEHLKKIVDTYEKREPKEKYSHVASFDEVKGNDFNLNIPRYIDTFAEEDEIDIAVVQQEIEQLEAELVEVRKEMAVLLKEVAA